MLSHDLYAPTTSDDSAALESDVMRFMALLGFCLMVIFALVQSLPVAPVSQSNELVSQELLDDSRKQLKSELHALEEKLRIVEQRVANEKQELHKLLTDQSDLKQQMGNYQQYLNQQRQQVVELSEAVKKQQSKLNQVQTETERLLERFAVLRQQQRDIQPLKDAVEALSSSESKPIEPESSSQSPQQSAQDENGYSLRFASEQALLRLINRGQVNQLAKVGGHFWRLQNGRFIRAEGAITFYEMASHTVPSAIKRMLRQSVSISGMSKVTWAIELPGNIEQQLHARMAERSNGELIISADGRVNFAG